MLEKWSQNHEKLAKTRSDRLGWSTIFIKGSVSQRQEQGAAAPEITTTPWINAAAPNFAQKRVNESFLPFWARVSL